MSLISIIELTITEMLKYRYFNVDTSQRYFKFYDRNDVEVGVAEFDINSLQLLDEFIGEIITLGFKKRIRVCGNGERCLGEKTNIPPGYFTSNCIITYDGDAPLDLVPNKSLPQIDQQYDNIGGVIRDQILDHGMTGMTIRYNIRPQVTNEMRKYLHILEIPVVHNNGSTDYENLGNVVNIACKLIGFEHESTLLIGGGSLTVKQATLDYNNKIKIRIFPAKRVRSDGKFDITDELKDFISKYT